MNPVILAPLLLTIAAGLVGSYPRAYIIRCSHPSRLASFFHIEHLRRGRSGLVRDN